MKTTKALLTGAFVLVFGAACGSAMAKDTVDPDDFVNDASAKGIAEIEAGKLALQKSSSLQVKVLAQHIIDDHTAANKELTKIAQKKNLKVASDAELSNKAKAFVLKQHDGESFDISYAKNEVSAHKDAIELFNKAAISKDIELANFAKRTLPKLQEHLQAAEDLTVAVDKAQ